MIQILFKNGENNLGLQKYLDMCGQNIDRHIKMTCHEHYSASCITLKPKNIHLQESLFPLCISLSCTVCMALLLSSLIN